MFSTILVLAKSPLHLAAAAHAEGGGGITKIFTDFGINLPGILAQIVNFSIVAFLLWRFAFKPVMATLNERQQKIESGLKYAEEMLAKLAAAQQESAAIVKNAQLEASKIVDEARKTAKEYLDKQMNEATAKATDTLAKAQQAIQLEHRKMLADARSEIARLVVTTTERVLAKKLTDADRATYNEAATKELTAA